MMISDVFQMAIDKNIVQIKGRLSDDRGYCASAWLEHNGFSLHGNETMTAWERWLENKYPPKRDRRPSLRIIARLNDEDGWKWKRFLQAARRFEASLVKERNQD